MEPLALPGNGPSTSNEPVVPAEHRLEAEAEHRLEAEAEAGINLKFHFSDTEREILRDYFYHQGVTSVSKKNAFVICRIAAEVGCTEKQVKHWINAEQIRRRKQTEPGPSRPLSSSSQPASPIKIKKTYKRSGFQLFCSQEAPKVSGDCNTVISKLSKVWTTFSSEEKQSWKSKASSGSCWSEQPRKKFVRDLTSPIEDNMKSLSKLGYEGYTLLLNKSTGEHKVICSSDIAQDFISAEEQRGQGVEEKFFTFMCASKYLEGGKKRKRQKSYDDLLGDIRTDWKTKYVNACGQGRIPYSNPGSMKAAMMGLPQGITFKQPSLYKQPELAQIHKHLDKISFAPLTVSSTEDA